MLAVKIAGLGSFLPARRVTNAELERTLGIAANWIERATGVCERRYVTDETQVSMAVAATHKALVQAQLDVSDLDAIVFASAAPQQAIPCTAAFLQRALGAPEGRSACFDINATCLSFLFALQSVAHLVAAGVYRNVLICSSEIGSRSLNPHERESAVLFGDAAAAAVITRSQPDEKSSFCHALFETYSGGADLAVIEGGGTLHHPNDVTTDAEMNMFHMEGPAIFKLGASLIGPFLDRFFSALEWQRDDVQHLIPHQASRHALEQLTRRVGFTKEQLFLNIMERGNCIGASIPLALSEAVEQQRVQRGDYVLLLGTGAGLTLGATALIY